MPPTIALLLTILLSTSVACASVCADCEGDGDTDILDALLVAHFASGQQTPDAGQISRCEMDGAPGLSIIDALLIGQQAAGLLGVTCGCDPASRVWQLRQPATSPGFREYPGMAFDSGRGVTVLFGGGRDGSNDTWEWDGNDWQQRFPATSPPSRTRHAIAYDESRGHVVVFGGIQGAWTSGTRRGDTWEWDGIEWQERFPSTSPSPRESPLMAYDPDRSECVLWAGTEGHVQYHETEEVWRYDGNDWTLEVHATHPRWMSTGNGSLSYDTGRQVMVLQACMAAGVVSTWELSAAGWQERVPVGGAPPMRSDIRSVYDACAGVVIYRGEVLWSWDGTRWQQLPSALTGLVANPGIVYDSLRNKVVLFARRAGSPETWEF